MGSPKIRNNKMNNVFMSKIILSENKFVVDTMMHPTFDHAKKYAMTCAHPDPFIKVEVHIYAIPFGKLMKTNIFLLDRIKL